MTNIPSQYCCSVGYFKDLSFENYGLRFEVNNNGIIVPLCSYIGINGDVKKDGLSKMQAKRLVEFLNEFIEGKV